MAALDRVNLLRLRLEAGVAQALPGSSRRQKLQSEVAQLERNVLPTAAHLPQPSSRPKISRLFQVGR